LAQARALLGARTIKDTVNGALRLVSATHQERAAEALDVLASIDFSGFDRGGTWS
jgi:hypothetical protein